MFSLSKLYTLQERGSKKDSPNWLSFLVNSLIGLGRLAGAGGANVNAGAAILAFSRIDHIQAIAGSDGAFGAFSFTSTTANAVTGDDVGHELCPFMSRLEIISVRIAQQFYTVNGL